MLDRSRGAGFQPAIYSGRLEACPTSVFHGLGNSRLGNAINRMGTVMRQISGMFRANLAFAAVLTTVGVAGVVYFVDGGTMFSPGNLKAEPRLACLGGRLTPMATWPKIVLRVMLRRGAGKRWPIAAWNATATSAGRSTPAARFMASSPMRYLPVLPHRAQGAHGSLTSLAGFDHNCAAFKLTGAHRKVDCQSCHKTPGYQGVSQSCISCHAEPRVHQGKFGTNCVQCHSTNTWVSTPISLAAMGFDHDVTGFKLTGKHAKLECRACHADEKTFTGKSQACNSCHQPVVHKGRFSANCTQCHTTNTWDGAIFNHNTVFRLPHHDRNNTCSKCHTNQASMKVYSCTECHEHRPARVLQQHRGKSLESIRACADCHGPGGPRRVCQDVATLLKPCATNPLTIPAPMPCEAPVTTAVFRTLSWMFTNSKLSGHFLQPWPRS